MHVGRKGPVDSSDRKARCREVLQKRPALPAERDLRLDGTEATGTFFSYPFVLRLEGVEGVDLARSASPEALSPQVSSPRRAGLCEAPCSGAFSFKA